MKMLRLLLLLVCLESLSTYADAERAIVIQQGAVATVNELATRAGVDALQKGGNAVDAAIAAAAMLGVVDGHNSGIGGGCFALVRLASGKIIALDGREMAPAKASRDMFIRDGKVLPQLSQAGALAVGIPGSVAVYAELSERAGKLPWSVLWLPAAVRAEQGFVLSDNYAQRLKRSALRLRDFPASNAVFLDADDEPWPAGHVLKQMDLANTYRQLAEKNTDYFYRGEFAKKTAEWMLANGGIVTQKDFSGYRLIQRQPLQTEYRGFTIYGFPPPSSGGVHIAEILNMLENTELIKKSPEDRQHLLA